MRWSPSHPFSYWMSEEMAREQQALYMAGVEVQATAFLNLMRGDWLHRGSHPSERWILVLCGILLGASLVRLHPLVCAGVGVAAVILPAALSSLLLRNAHTWFPWLFVVAQILVALGWSVLYNSVQLYLQKRLYEHTLRLYLPPKLVKRFASKPSLLKPGAEKQVLTLFFSDIADFTSLSEGMDSDELAALMNDYFQTAVGECIHAADGTVAKYIGDAILAFWNAPAEQPNDHAVLACEAMPLAVCMNATHRPSSGISLHIYQTALTQKTLLWMSS